MTWRPPEKPERLAPPIEVILLDEISSKLSDLTELMTKPAGAIYPIKVRVEGTVTIDFIKGAPYRPLFSLTLYNDGPGNVYPSVNVRQTLTYIKSGESLEIDLRSPSIRKLFLSCEDGYADVRGFGVY